MPASTISVHGVDRKVTPSGLITQYDQDEFALVFQRGTGGEQEVRVTRYSPQGARSREQSFAELSEERLVSLFGESQPGLTSPEAGNRQ
jgi:hypothetical protein